MNIGNIIQENPSPKPIVRGLKCLEAMCSDNRETEEAMLIPFDAEMSEFSDLPVAPQEMSLSPQHLRQLGKLGDDTFACPSCIRVKIEGPRDV